MPHSLARLCDEHPECTAIYHVKLDDKFTTGPNNCNDRAMLPPHGRNQLQCKECRENVPADIEGVNCGVGNDPRMWGTSSEKHGWMDYSDHPYPEDELKQSNAVAKNAHVSLTEASEDCYAGTSGNANCAFPLGFMTDRIVKHGAVCVKVENVKNSWLEIMATSSAGSDGGSFCVSDWGEGEDVACTKEGDLAECRESGNLQIGSKTQDTVQVKFFAQDNFDDANIDFQWRIAASKVRSSNSDAQKTDPENIDQSKDAEDWCQFRDGADFPQSLMKPYPVNYVPPDVFGTALAASGAGATASSAVAIAIALLGAVLL